MILDDHLLKHASAHGFPCMACGFLNTPDNNAALRALAALRPPLPETYPLPQVDIDLSQLIPQREEPHRHGHGGHGDGRPRHGGHGGHGGHNGHGGGDGRAGGRNGRR